MIKLNSRERLDRCFKHMEIDRPGLFIRGVGLGNPAHESYRPLRELVLENCDLKSIVFISQYKDTAGITYETKRCDEDFEKRVTTIHTPKGDLRMSYMMGLKGQPGYTEKHFIETWEEAEMYLSMPEPSLLFNPDIYFKEDRMMGDRGIVVADLGLNPAGTVVELLGSERFAFWSIEYRDMLHALMEKEKHLMVRIVKQLAKDKVGPYFAILGEEYITPPLHGPVDFCDFNVIYDKPVIDLIHEIGGYIHVHCHGPLKNVLKCFVDMGTDVLHPIEAPQMGNVTAKEAKEVLRDKVCIEGNVQIGDMYENDNEAIKDMATALIRDAFDDSKGLIVCPTASPYVPVMTEKVFQNYNTLINTVLEFK